MKVTALVENTCLTGSFPVEHGLSLYIETKENKILFDMGQSQLFYDNAKKMGIDIGQVDIAVLSHGHYDHGGGLGKFLEVNNKATVYLSKYAFEPHYNGTEKYIGLDRALCDNERLVFVDDTVKVDKNLTLYSCNENKRLYPVNSGGLNKIENGKFTADDFCHEQYLVIEDKGKRILISGCSHKGIMDIVSWFKPDVLIGGFHFSKFDLDEKLKEYATYLDKFKTEYYTCHCTGIEQFKFMKIYMNRLNYLSTGDVIEL